MYDMASNQRASQIVENLNHQWHRLELGILAMEGRLERNIKEHLSIGEAILAEDGDKARDILLSHFDNLQATIKNIMQIFRFPN
jgi:DNA-binding GntR family transcriptional regulator